MQMLATRLYTTTHVHALEFMFHFQKVPRGAVICQQKGWCAIEAQVAQRTNTYVRQYVHCVIKAWLCEGIVESLDPDRLLHFSPFHFLLAVHSTHHGSKCSRGHGGV